MLYDHYRCGCDIGRLIEWLRSKGDVSKTPLHSLRKEYASQINARYGLTAAQEMLRHADIQVTAAHYVENKQRSVLGFGHLLTNDRTIIPIEESKPTAPLTSAVLEQIRENAMRSILNSETKGRLQ